MPKADWKHIQTIVGDLSVSTVLDVGCGLSLKSQYIDADIRLGLDIYEPYLRQIEADVPYVTICADAMLIGDLFPEDSFDLVLLLDIIEHLDKVKATQLLAMAERIGGTVIVETPEGYIPQNIDIWGHGGDHWQTHRSGWQAWELEQRGYLVTKRDYTMCDVRRHTELDVETNIVMLDGIWKGEKWSRLT